MTDRELSRVYEPTSVEARWQRVWAEEQLFRADPQRGRERAYCIVIPPPNVTGSLHCGHALNNTLQDVLVRYHRMLGDNVLWLPGTDHAGIATQTVVERELIKEGTSRKELGRDRFVERVWRWKEQSGGRILHQLQRLGCSCDWSRERFTMDEGLSRAVREVFVRLHREGLVDRDEWLVNWDPASQTAISDLEVEHKEVDGHLWHVRYPVVGSDEGVVVATTRPETMLGDTAVAVHPDDERYRHLVGREVELPLLGRRIPVIADAYVDVEFGTGVVKITPAHDFNDFEVGNRHGLPRINVLTDSGVINQNGGVYAGLDRFEARKAVVRDLEAGGFLVKTEPHRHSVGHAQRSGAVVEPFLSIQWFVRIKALAEPAIAAVEQGQIRIVPQQWESTYFHWMRNIRDWCISRQLWWGHRIPAWYCQACGHITVETDEPAACAACGGGDLVQETDVLDTWFSSGLWPFSTLGWPDRTPDLETWYPTSVLVTAADILFFWVARMAMMGLKFMREVPFRDVYLHAIVTDENGEKMSKTRGNVIDPLDMMDRFGTDAFRFTLAAYAAQGRNIRLSESRIEGYRNFVNKLWNAARFTLMNLAGDETPLSREEQDALADRLGLPERWILSRLSAVSRDTAAAIDDYRFNDAAMGLYHFVWGEFCDWYLELSKGSLARGGEGVVLVRRVLATALGGICRLLHPFTPFVTEEIWSHLPGARGRLAVAAFPREADFRADPGAEEELAFVSAVVGEVRKVRSELNVPPAARVEVRAVSSDPRLRGFIEASSASIAELCRAESVTTAAKGPRPKGAAHAVVEGVDLFIPLLGLLDVEAEVQRLGRELKKADDDVAFLAGRLANPSFVDRAPPAIVEKEREKHAAAFAQREKIAAALERLRELA